MTTTSSAALAEYLRDLGAHIRVIVIHPNYLLPRLLLSSFLGGVYVSLDETLTSAEAIHAAVERAFQEQAIAPIESVPFLVLDECDRVNEAALLEIVRVFVGKLDHGRLILFTRSTPASLLDETVLREQMRFFPHDEALMLWDYAQRNEDSALLEVRALGTGHVLLNGRVVDNWDGVLPRALFFYLIDRGMATRTEIFETFWPNLTVREATNVFHVTKRKISEVLKIDLTRYGASYYHISPQIQLSYDVMLFTKLVQDGSLADGQEAVALLERALLLYRGAMMTSLHADWVQQRRRSLQFTYAEALEMLGQTLEQLGEARRALGYYRRASAVLRTLGSAGSDVALSERIAALERALALR
jgi:tetratricopeptide (TPR) repeat protein